MHLSILPRPELYIERLPRINLRITSPPFGEPPPQAAITKSPAAPIAALTSGVTTTHTAYICSNGFESSPGEKSTKGQGCRQRRAKNSHQNILWHTEFPNIVPSSSSSSTARICPKRRGHRLEVHFRCRSHLFPRNQYPTLCQPIR